MRTLENYKGGRFYIVDEVNNIVLPSVTTILGKMTDSSHIKKWQDDIGIDKANFISQRAANRGLICMVF